MGQPVAVALRESTGQSVGDIPKLIELVSLRRVERVASDCFVDQP